MLLSGLDYPGVSHPTVMGLNTNHTIHFSSWAVLVLVFQKMTIGIFLVVFSLVLFGCEWDPRGYVLLFNDNFFIIELQSYLVVCQFPF